MIYYLNSSEKYRSRALWEQAFPEDSAAFVDYYYQEKTADNQILVKEEGGQIVSMLHRNPYQIAVGRRRWECSYLVGVATAAGSRRRGFMRELMGKSLADMRKERMPFCFLMPASREYYLPFGFADIFKKTAFLPDETRLSALRAVKASGDTADNVAEAVARFMNRWLKERYEVYAVRSKEYVRRLCREIGSEDGTLEIYYQNGRYAQNGGRQGGSIEGVHAEWGLVTKEQRLLMCGRQYCVENGCVEPGIMGRIVDLPKFVKAIRLKDEAQKEEMTVILNVTDPQIPENHGIWRWKLDRKTSGIRKLSDEDSVRPDLVLDIGELTEWLFGYRVPKEAEAFCGSIRTLKGVFLDEIV